MNRKAKINVTAETWLYSIVFTYTLVEEWASISFLYFLFVSNVETVKWEEKVATSGWEQTNKHYRWSLSYRVSCQLILYLNIPVEGNDWI